MPVQVRPITAADLPAVAEFLHSHLNQRVSPEAWARAMQVPWKVDAPNHGFLLRATGPGEAPDGGAVVGAYLAFYSERQVAGQPRRFCNLGAWCVAPKYRFQAARLLKALLAQEGFSFTDLSPSGNVVPINTRLGFQLLDTTTALVPCLPRPSWPGRIRITADPAVLQETLTGRSLEIYRDHAETAAARHLVLIRGDRWCYVMFRKDRRKRLPLFASVLHVSDPDLFRAAVGPFTRRLLVRHGVLALLAEARVVGHRPRGSVRLGSARPKMFRGDGLAPEQVDYLYSELACVAW